MGSFGFEGRMWNLIVSVPDHCLSFYFSHDVAQLKGLSPMPAGKRLATCLRLKWAEHCVVLLLKTGLSCRGVSFPKLVCTGNKLTKVGGACFTWVEYPEL